jgi:hypothetical protein
MNSFIFIRGLRHVDHSVFCVESGQKTYRDPVFGNILPYSSGQQVKRSVIELIGDELQSNPSAVEFVFGVNNKGALEEKEVLSLCDPQYYDQIIGGWMSVAEGGKSRTLKRRSPLSISAMRPLHPTLCRVEGEQISFDRSDKPELHKVTVRDANGNIMNKEEIESLLDGANRSLFRKWIPENNRAYGLFIYDIAIDLRTLFCVQTNQFEPEITPDKVEELKTKGWIVSKNAFGECLVMPKGQRDKIIPAIAKALINWRISSNQARTFSLMETLAVAISQNANTLAGAIRAKLSEDERRAKPIIDETARANLYITLPCSGYIITESESADALEEAEAELIQLMSEFDYENQL